MNILVTGGISSRIGKNIVGRLLEEGHTVIATYRNDISNDKLPQSERLHTFKLDISEEADVKDCFNHFFNEKALPIDTLINNAGTNVGGMLTQLKTKDWKEMIDTNLTGTFLMCKYFSKYAARRKKGQIINIGSSAANGNLPYQGGYNASKAGLISLSKTLAVELAPYNLRVNIVNPGFIPSQLNQFSEAKEIEETEKSLLGIKHNLSNLVDFISFICADSLSGVTGQEFNIDSRLNK
ncbi:MAG: SDR family NAD(P)-dependent oxidoreductase [Crocinitomix sp.]|nr:SDR family NAD(P)-dependent oxidoreductase [Crocinitomix sp.]